MLSEAYLGHPVAEYLIHRHKGQFDAEANHPAFHNVGRGRPRQIDYVLRSPRNGEIQVAIECKWISETPYDRQRILNDILRLECVRIPGVAIQRFLLVAGSREQFKANFENLTINDNGKRRSFTKHFLRFSIDGDDKKVRLRDGPEAYRSNLRVFSESFRKQLPHALKTRLLERRTADGLRVYIWQISSIQNRQEFWPNNQWGRE